MIQEIDIQVIGHVEKTDHHFIIHLDPEYYAGLSEIDGFSHLQIIWWGHICDSPEMRKKMELGKLFRNGPTNIGSFATRSPVRPNPILVSIIKVSGIDPDQGQIFTSFIDAEPGSPVLDIKPYMRMERVKDCNVPAWCSHWPEWQEEAVQFDWSEEINIRKQ